jgi:uncharacterized protein YggU (UPF0235/DUF167 family)
MTDAITKFRNGRSGAAITVHIVPRGRENGIQEILNDGTIKIRLTAGVVDDEINKMLLDFLSGVLEMPVKNLDIVGGTVGLEKLVTILDLDANTVHRRIIDHLA